MIWIIIGIVIYLLSTFGMWKYVNLLYSKKGKWCRDEPDFVDIFLTVVPVVNTASLFNWFTFYPLVEEKKPFNYNKFFKIK
jgi:hypothetical protein